MKTDGTVHIQPVNSDEWKGCDAALPSNPRIRCSMVRGRGHGSTHKRITKTGRVTHRWTDNGELKRLGQCLATGCDKSTPYTDWTMCEEHGVSTLRVGEGGEG